MRRIQLRMWLFAVPVYALAIAFAHETWLLIVLGVGALIGLENVISLSIRVRREEPRAS